jgi:hypothetical protein
MATRNEKISGLAIGAVAGVLVYNLIVQPLFNEAEGAETPPGATVTH